MAHNFAKKWRSEDVRVRGNVDFSSLLLSDKMLEGLKKAGFKKPSPIQFEAIPRGCLGKDLLVQAKSGTGKTLVFVTVALEILRQKFFRPQVLVVVPTREIATQICSVVKLVGEHIYPTLTCNSFIGGLPLWSDQEKAVRTQIVVGTPGRLKQLIEMKSLPTNSIRLLVFDEADELLYSNSFKDAIDDIFTSLPDDKQVIATSATFNPTTKKHIMRYLGDTDLVRLNVKQLALLGTIHYAAFVEYCPMPILQYRFKLAVLENILKTVQFSQCLLFCNGVQRVEVLYSDIKKWGFSTAYISSAKEQTDRLKAMEKLKRFKCKVLVSSDLTARGIDAENVDLVINFDFSSVTEVYLHRVGRAGRYGSVGVAISILAENELRNLKKIEKGGSFRTYKLPDPIPHDLILYPVQEDFVFNESDLESRDCPEDNKSVESNNVQQNVIKKKKCRSKKQGKAKKLQGKKASDTNVDIDDGACENALSETVTQSTSEIKSLDDITMSIEECVKMADDVILHLVHDGAKDALLQTTTPENEQSYDDITNSTAECEVKVEKAEEDISHSVHSNEHAGDKILQNGYIKSSNVNLGKSKNSDLLDECDQSKLINGESTEIICIHDHIHENGLCDENVIVKQGIINDNIEKDFVLNPQLSNENQKNIDFEVNGKILIEVCIDDVSEFKDTVETAEDDSVNCDKKIVESDDTLNKVRAFVDKYELSKEVESTEMKVISQKDSQLKENTGKKLITVDMINDLKSQKNDFFYKTLKTFLEKKDSTSAAHENNKEDETEKNNENIDMLLKNANNTELVNAEINPVHVRLTEKPNFESTPQSSDKENSKVTADEAVYNKLTIPNKMNQIYHEFSDESDYNDSGTNEKVANQNASVDSDSLSSDSETDSLSSDSETDSLSSDSETDSLSSDSETDYSSGHSKSEMNSDNSDMSSSTSSESEGSYSHYHSRTGRQNPSLISNPSRSRKHHDHIPANYFPDDTSPCFSAAKHYIPQQSTFRSFEISREKNKGRRHRDQNQSISVPFSEEESASYFRRAYQPANSRGNLPCSRRDFHDLNASQSYFPRSHLSCCRSKISQRNKTREEDVSRSESPHQQRSSRHSRSMYSHVTKEEQYRSENPSRRRSSKCHSSMTLHRNVARKEDVDRSESPTRRRSSRHHRPMNSHRNITKREDINRSENPTARRSFGCDHDINCFMPTVHRCHPYVFDCCCSQASICEIWYETFYKQWLHIQNMIN